MTHNHAFDDLLDFVKEGTTSKTYMQDPLALLLQLKDNFKYDDCRVVDEMSSCASINVPINPQNIEKSKEIFEHYSDKFLFNKIRGQDLSPYRARLMNMYNRFNKYDFTVSTDDIKALWRLDNMYTVDNITAAISKKHKSADNQRGHCTIETELKPAVCYTHLRSKTKFNGDKKVFVFTDASNVAYTLEVKTWNNLLPLIDFMFSQNMPITAKITGTLKLLTPDCNDFWVIKIVDFRLTKELV